jgi:thiol-disulfide isomerase/thioredoxin
MGFWDANFLMRKCCFTLSLMACTWLYGQKIYQNFADFAPYLQRNNDTVYVLNIWATWCAPCVQELPLFERLYREYAGKPLKILLLSMDFRKEYESKLLPFLARKKLSVPVAVLWDSKQDEWIERIDPAWNGTIPATLIFRGERRIFHDVEIKNYTQLHEWVEKMFAP